MGQTPSNIEWCEAVTHAHVYTPYVAEFFNTWSNSVFLLVGSIGLFRVNKRVLNTSSKIINYRQHVFTDGMLLMVGLGSMWFHSQRSYLGEILDELPMSIMAFGYMLCLDQLHWLTSGNFRGIVYTCMLFLLVLGWMFYVIWDAHEIFTTLFTIQILVPILISGDSSIAGKSRFLWYATIISIVSGKIIWEYERYLYVNNQCPSSQSSLLFWCHPLWHCLSAASHYFWIKYVSEIPFRENSSKKQL